MIRLSVARKSITGPAMLAATLSLTAFACSPSVARPLKGEPGLSAISPIAPLNQDDSRTTTSPKAVAERLVEAFNAKDPAAMVALVSEDFELYYVGNDGKSERAASGRDELAAQMTEYFKSYPNVRSVIDGVINGPVFVSFRERVFVGEQSKSQSSIAVYEVRDGLIRRTWYFPTESDSPD